MDKARAVSAISLIRASYNFLPRAALPGTIGTVVYTALFFIGQAIRDAGVFGQASAALSLVPGLAFGAAWFGLVFRIGLGLPRARYILALGRQELAFATSFVGFVFVLSIVGALVGFLVFLITMMIAVIGGGALTGVDVAVAPIFETPEAFRAFLTDTSEGQVIGVVGLTVVLVAALFLFWLVIRLSPFAPAAVAQKRFVVLQAMSWTRYKDRPLVLAGLATIGVAFTLIFLSRALIFGLGFPILIGVVLVNLVACFSILVMIGYLSEVYRQTVGLETVQAVSD